MKFSKKLIFFILLLLVTVLMTKVILVKQRAKTDSEYALGGEDQFRTMPISAEVIRESEDIEILMLNLLYEKMSFKEKCIFDNHLSLYERMVVDTATKAYIPIIQGLRQDMKQFPVDCRIVTQGAISYENSWGMARSYGGARIHEGCDLMPPDNTPNLYPVLSASDGIVEKKGWLELGGYRLGVRSPQGIYFYYAHLSSYGDNIEVGTVVKAGDLLGYMGNTGYGEEGTEGKFNVHLHFGIYGNYKGREISVNPYPWLRWVDIL